MNQRNGTVTLSQVAQSLEQIANSLGALTIKGSDSELLANLRNALRNIASTLLQKEELANQAQAEVAKLTETSETHPHGV